VSGNSELSVWDMLGKPLPAGASGWDLLKDPANTAFMTRALPKLSKPVAPEHKMPPKMVWKALNTTLLPFAKQLLEKGAVGFTKKAEEDVNGLMQKITYPEPLINEAVNRYLQKFQK